MSACNCLYSDWRCCRYQGGPPRHFDSSSHIVIFKAPPPNRRPPDIREALLEIIRQLPDQELTTEDVGTGG